MLTLAGTVALYVVVPKGFLPQQDTGAIIATTEAAQNVSLPAMSGCSSARPTSCSADPAVDGVASLVGAGSVQPHAQCRPPVDHAEAAARTRGVRRR